MADLGNVMFILILDQGRVTIKKNMSGWGDDVLTDVLGPMAQTIFLPHLVENAIIQQETEDRLQHRSRRGDGNQETFVFDRDGRLWQEYTLRAFSFLGEIERVQRIRFSDFKPIPDWPVPYPHRIEVDDEIHGFKARISVRSLTPN